MSENAFGLEDCVGMPAREFVLHRESMLLLDTLVNCSELDAECEWRVGPDAAFMETSKGVPSYIGVEHMAQCVAVHAGAKARVAGFGPPLGLLLGTRHFRAEISYFQVNKRYLASCVELIRDENGMASYECSVRYDERIIATARLSVLEKERGIKLK